MSLDKDFEHYYTSKPTSPFKVKEVVLSLKNGRMYKFKTPSGVFSFGQIDKASKLLIEHAIIGETDRLLDLGCGYGVIGITLKKENPDISLCMSDVNERALEFAKINAKNNNIVADIRLGNLYEPWKDEIFDNIVCNPPIAAGKKVWEKIIVEAPDHLSAKGKLQLVAYHNKGGERLKKIMKSVFGNVRETVESGGIRVYVSIKL